MQNYSTILGVIKCRQSGIPFSGIERRYHLGASAASLIMTRFKDIGKSYQELAQMDPWQVEDLFYPPDNLRRKQVPMPDFQYYYDRMNTAGSRVNVSYCWIDYKSKHPDGYEATQFYEYFNRFVREHYGSKRLSMAVERVPGEKLYIDWVGDKPALLTDPATGEIKPVCVFTTTLGVSSRVFAEIFPDEKLPSFIKGVTDAIEFYGGVPKYLVPDNLKTAVTKHTKDELVLNSAFQDLEEFYDTIVLPPPARKPKGKPAVEDHVRILETHLLEKLKEDIYTSLEQLNEATQKITAAINNWKFQKKPGTRNEWFEKYDKPHMKPLPGGKYATCDYKYFTSVPNTYHLEYDGHYYSVLYTYYGKPAILKATPSEIRICDSNNRLITTHRRSYKEFPKYITVDSDMPPEHQYYKEVNAHTGTYYRRWANVYGPYMEQLIDTVLKNSVHEEQSYNSCAGILHSCTGVSCLAVEAAAEKCVKMHSCRYSAFKKALRAITQAGKDGPLSEGQLPNRNVRGKEHYFQKN